MAQEPESTEVVMQVVESTEKAENLQDTENVPVVMPPDSAAVPEEIPKTVEDSQPITEEPIVQEAAEPTTELNEDKGVTEATQETEATEPIAHETTAPEGEPTEGQDDLSPEERSKKERKERMKNFASTRFRISEAPVRTISMTDDYVQDKVEEEEQKTGSAVNFDEPSQDDNLEESDHTDDSEDDLFQKIQAHKMVELFPVHGFSNPSDNQNIFYKDPKYDDFDDTMSVAAMSVISSGTLAPTDPDTVQLKSNFLKYFDVPSLSDISEEHDPIEQLTNVKSSTSDLLDQGAFVDPTQEFDSSSKSTIESVVDIENEQQDDFVAPDSRDGSSIISDIPDFAELPEKPAPTEKVVTIEDFNALPRVGFEDVEDEPDPSIPLAYEIKMAVQDLLRDILHEATIKSDYQDQENVLRAKLDKTKLLIELQKVTDAYMYEKYTNDMVGSRLVEYYKRSRNNRAFATLSAENEKRYHARYIQALALLDSLKERLDVAKHKHAIQMNRVILDLHSAQSVASITEEQLEHLFHKYLDRPDCDNLRRMVSRELRLMSAKRNEISDTRLFLITRKHTMAHILDKITLLDTLSDTVSIKDYIAVQNEVLSLQKKIEERSVELKRIRTQFLMDIHLIRHNQEKAMALREKFDLHQDLLKNAITQQVALRTNLYEAKLERTKMRQMSKDLTFQGGILAMPSLMYDFDKTVERLKEKQESVAKLRETMKSLQRRVSNVEGRSI
ncbi:uncharacterized protein LOC108111910 [Drosophila eugracilis]|uniref:uncharacterized protein LOC108111910 n=1 Tax=Drosophila eugracilis TaxID=29029 RepID=UPI0007E80E41|nr:uncharacterized protein LOC108111910 [Drosophila eugracilis]